MQIGKILLGKPTFLNIYLKKIMDNKNSNITPVYEKSVKNRTKLRFILGIYPRFKQFLKHERARYIARKNGATIGKGVIIPISLARTVNKNLTIGDHSSVNISNFSSMRYPISIGKNVIIGNDVKIILGSHNIDSTEWEHIRKSPPLVIEDYVWICPYSIILPSCSKIEYGTVVGAGSIVSKNLEEMSVYGGNPAKKLRKRKCVHSDLVVESLHAGDLIQYIKSRLK